MSIGTLTRRVILYDADGNPWNTANPLPVTAASLPLPSGAATEAKQDVQETTLNAIQAAVDGLEGLLTTIDADTGTIAGDTTSIDGKVTECDTSDTGITSVTPPTVTHSASVTVATTSATTLVSAVASKAFRIWSITVTNDHATNSEYIEFSDDNAATYKHRINIPPQMSRNIYFQHGWDTDTENEAFKARLGAAVASFYVTVAYTEIDL